MKDIDEIISQVPSWRGKSTIHIEPLAGLTNQNYAVRVNGQRYVVRISGENTRWLGIDRSLERQVITAASKAGIGPEIVEFFLPEGNLITRYIQGRHLTLKEYRSKDTLRRIVKQVKRLHTLTPVKAVFSPFSRIKTFANHAQSLGVSLPPDIEMFFMEMAYIEQEQVKDPYPWWRFCHNDLFCVNVMDDGNIKFIDWEFAGMGDIYYDLATLTYAYDSTDTLSIDLQAYVLEIYFGGVDVQNWKRLAGMKIMVMFFSAMWSLLQKGMENEGLLRPVDGFDFIEYANTTFEGMRRAIKERN